MKWALLIVMAASGVTACAHHDPYAPRPSSYTEPVADTADPAYGFPPAQQYWMGSPGSAGWGYYGGPATTVNSPTPSRRPSDPISTPPVSTPPVSTRPPPAAGGGGAGSRGGISTRRPRSINTRTRSSHREAPVRDEH